MEFESGVYHKDRHGKILSYNALNYGRENVERALKDAYNGRIFDNITAKIFIKDRLLEIKSHMKLQLRNEKLRQRITRLEDQLDSIKMIAERK